MKTICHANGRVGRRGTIWKNPTMGGLGLPFDWGALATTVVGTASSAYTARTARRDAERQASAERLRAAQEEARYSQLPPQRSTPMMQRVTSGLPVILGLAAVGGIMLFMSKK